MRIFTPARVSRTTTILIMMLIGLAWSPVRAAGTPTGQPVVYAITPGNTITVVDTGNRQLLDALTLPSTPGFIVGTPDGKRLYVTGHDPSSNPVLWVIDTQTDLVTTTLPLAQEAVGMVVSSDGSRVYVAWNFSFFGNGVTVVDTASNTIATEIADTFYGTNGVAITPNGKRLYVPMIGRQTESGGLDVIDTSTNTILAGPTIPNSDYEDWSWVAISPDSSKGIGRVDFAVSANPMTSYMIFDTASNLQVGMAPLDGAELSTPLPGSNTIYGTKGGSLIAYNVQTNSIAATIPVASAINGLALSPDAKQLYVSNSNAQSLAVIDTASNTLTGTVAVAGAAGLAVLPAPPPFVLSPPVVTVTLAQTNIPPASTTTVQSTSSGATSCTASGDWSASKGLQGTAPTASFPAAGSHTYTLTCTGPGGTSAASAKLTVNAGSMVTLSASEVQVGASVTVSWTAFPGANVCVLDAPYTSFSKTVATSGSQAFGSLPTGTVSFVLTCGNTASGIQQVVTKTVLVDPPGQAVYISIVPPNNNVYAFGTPGTPPPATGLASGYAFDSKALQSLSQPIRAFGQTFTLGTAAKPSGISGLSVALSGEKLTNLTLLATAVNGSQLNQKFVVAYSDGTSATFTQSLGDWAATGVTSAFPGEDGDDTSLPITMQDRITPTGAAQAKLAMIHGYQFTLDPTKAATSLQLPKNRDVIVLAINETKAALRTAEPITPAYNVTALASFEQASTGARLAEGYAYDADLVPNGFIGAGQSFALGAPDQPDAVSNTTIKLAAKARISLTILATGVNGSQANQLFVVGYQDGSSTVFKQSLSDWHQPQNFAGETIARNTGLRISPSGTQQAGVWDLYAYTFTTDPSKKVVSLTLPKNRNVVVLAVNGLAQ